jgi:hypothetical protein
MFAGAVLGIAPLAHAGHSPNWTTVVNNGQLMPNSKKLFNSYNQPSIDSSGFVVFRARSKGPGQPVRGIYGRDMTVPASGLDSVAAVEDEVPQPNNTPAGGSGSGLAKFLEFPSFPRVDVGSRMIATRAQTQPTWTFLQPDGTESRIGTAGVYATIDGKLETGTCLLGSVRDAATGALVFPWWQVPGAAEGTRFDQFPGAASPCDGEYVVFKGNWTDAAAATGRTGVYFRSMTGLDGQAAVQRIADSQMAIPGQTGPVTLPFGSTAPPSAANGRAVFLGVDNEEAPTLGGIYLAELLPDPPLAAVVALGDQVPGEAKGASFNRIGEALSFDGRWVGFWASWGTETRSITLFCPVDGNEEIIKYCNETYPDGFTVEVPVHQGFFVADTATGEVHVVAKTGAVIDDMMYWNFSGSPPGSGGGKGGGKGGDKGGEQEPPRWRSASFIAVSGVGADAFQSVFKASSAGQDHLFRSAGALGTPQPFVGTGTAGLAIDADAPAGSAVVSIGIERDALRGGVLAMTASMLDSVTGESWAGVYVAPIAANTGCAADVDGDGVVGAVDLASLLVEWDCAALCTNDLDGDGLVGVLDLNLLLNAWGPCDGGG